MNTKTVKVFDPPGGWRYGFPKEYRPLPDETLVQWLIREGYPADQAEWAIGYLRSWEVLQPQLQSGQTVSAKE